MGTDLRLLPIDHLSGDTTPWGFSHTVLNLPRNREAWDAINQLAAESIPESANVTSHVGARVPDGRSQGEPMYGRLTKDAYGSPYKWVRAGDLVRVLDRYFPGEPTTAYVNAMNGDALVILDWH